jgi:hypothetical protein
VTDTGGVRIADAIAFPDINSLFAFGSLNTSNPSNSLNSSTASFNVSQYIEESIPRWAAEQAAGGGGVSVEALETVFRALAQGIINHNGALVHSASKTRR